MAGSKRARKQISYAEEDYNTEDEEEVIHEDTVDSDDEPKSKKKKKTNTNTTSLGTWSEEHGGSLITFIHKDFVKPDQDAGAVKILSFDFDSTLVSTKSGRAFATDANDWKLWHDSVTEKLHSYQKKGYLIVIFTNQNGIGKGKLTVSALRGRIEGFMNKVGSDLKFLVFAATQEDHFRKPSVGMWTYMENHVLDGLTIDKDNSKYVGDAAGRPKGWASGKKKDHSCGDRKFALNVGIGFATPEGFFLGEKEYSKWSLDGFDIKTLEDINKKPYKAEDLISNKQEVVLFVGYPASGKSTFFKRYFEPNGYVHVNRDTLKTPAKCLKACQEALENGKSVVIDNTNPSVSAREPYIEAAQEAEVPIRCFVFKTDEELAKHLNVYRENKSLGAHKHVPRVGYATYKKNFDEPKKSEGFSEVRQIDFIPVFTDDQAKTTFFHYT